MPLERQSMSYSRPKDLARRMAGDSARLKSARRDSYRRETFSLPREAAREKAREIFRRFSQGGLHDRDRKLARAAGRRHRVHHAAAAERGLIVLNLENSGAVCGAQ